MKALNHIDYLHGETLSLLTRMEQMKPFTSTIPMVRSASVSNTAMDLVNSLLGKGKLSLIGKLNEFMKFIRSEEAKCKDADELFNLFTVLKLRYNSILDQLDIYSDVLSQRSEHETGMWLSGLDVLAEDGLTPGKEYYDSPALMVYLDRGHGAAIRRARTRLPGDDENPVAVIQIPRERMVGNGIASSLIHEVGHQGAELLGLTDSLRNALSRKKSQAANPVAWLHYEKWISEILADLWALSQLGISATLGLMGVVTLPKYFQFRIDLDDPHPAPYVRVMLSCAAGKKLFPDAQWDKQWELWKTFYPTSHLDQEKKMVIEELGKNMNEFLDIVFQHQCESMKGKRMMDLFNLSQVQPEILRNEFQSWKRNSSLISQARPIRVFAVLGQAKADQKISSHEESHLLQKQLNWWAVNR